MAGRIWSEEEKLVIKKFYQDKGPQWLAKSGLLPGRSRGAISEKARSMGIIISAQAISEALERREKRKKTRTKNISGRASSNRPGFLQMATPDKLLERGTKNEF